MRPNVRLDRTRDRKPEISEREVAIRPMRSFALGVVGLIAAILTTVLLCVTVVGIPFAILLVLIGALAGYAGVCAVLTTVGGMLVGHKSKSVYVHLAVGCVPFMLTRPIPWLGDLVLLVVVMIGLGALVATRGAGIWPQNGREEPYRTPATT
jgi:hypothetical protein